MFLNSSEGNLSVDEFQFLCKDNILINNFYWSYQILENLIFL